ncbi:GLIPR1-like protein 1 [Mesocricetus auratus]|uniref:GLIPR1-like protein 1 n=1 Tax=Mesocricetus auratus TaxID=10036 RepID=A0ABM2Y7J6_MESAU|nr:GLIPR1-like protein 1 [Mesocricetus auratus]
MALMKKLDCFWTLSLCLVASKLCKALLDVPKLPTIYDPKFIEECVDSHNEFRSKVKPSAADMNELIWDNELAKVAKSWSIQCKFFHNPCTKKRYACIEGHDFLGENVYVGEIQSTPKQIISSWYNESEHYNFENTTCSKICGHYTQMVWANTLTVGCAVSNCPNLLGHSAALFVCNYAPPGNEKNYSPYIKGEPCSLCKRDDCRNNLCQFLTEKATQPRACHLLLLGFILHRIF